jgi:hypothetical protein
VSRSRRHRIWQSAAVALAGALTIALTQNTTTASFTARTGDVDNSVTTATSFCVSPDGTTLDVLNDTFVDQSNPGSTNGGSGGLTVRSGSGAHAHAYLRFQLPPLPRHCRITDARLRLHATSSQGTGTIDVHRASATWTSAAATWSMANRPAPAGTAVGAAMGVTGWHEWTVTILVRELYAGPDHGFLVKDRLDNASPSRTTVYDSLDSGTAANRPQLVLTWG